MCFSGISTHDSLLKDITEVYLKILRPVLNPPPEKMVYVFLYFHELVDWLEWLYWIFQPKILSFHDILSLHEYITFDFANDCFD